MFENYPSGGTDTMNISAVDREQQIFEAIPASAGGARKFVGEILRLRDAPDSVVVDFQLVVSELVANAIEHGDGDGLTVRVDCSDHHWWEIEVVSGLANNGYKIQQSKELEIAGNEHSSGRGLGIVRKLMDDVVTDISAGLVTVRCRQRRVEN